MQTALVDFYGKCGEIGSARKVFDSMPAPNVVSWTALMVGYVVAGDLESAKSVFDEMPSRNVAAWNAMIDGCVKGGNLVTARRLFDKMPERNVVTFTSLIVGYAKSGDMSSARWLFDQCGRIDVVAWSALISGYAQNGRPTEAIKMFFDLYCDKNVRPDEYVLVSLMSACAQLGDKDLCKWVESYLNQSGLKLDEVHVVSALVDMNAKCGNLDRALDLFQRLPRRDLVVYCSIMQGLSIHGNGAKAVELFSRMVDDGVVPDQVAFTVVLTACSHAGLVEEGRRYFNCMKEYGVSPLADHFACMVHLLARAGLLNEAYELLKSTPVESHAGAWGALLGASWQHGDTKLGEEVANKLFEIEPTNGGNYVLMSNIYAGADQWCKVCELRDKMRERGIKKITGRSWVSLQP